MKITEWENIFQRKRLIFVRQIMQIHFYCIMWVELIRLMFFNATKGTATIAYIRMLTFMPVDILNRFGVYLKSIYLWTKVIQ